MADGDGGINSQVGDDGGEIDGLCKLPWNNYQPQFLLMRYGGLHTGNTIKITCNHNKRNIKKGILNFY